MRVSGQNPSEDIVKTACNKLDPKKTGFFDFDTFMNVLGEVWQDIDYKPHIAEAFEVFDEDDSGTISAQELLHVMTNLGEKLSEKEILTLMKEGDLDGDGEIDLDEFMQMMSN